MIQLNIRMTISLLAGLIVTPKALNIPLVGAG